MIPFLLFIPPGTPNKDALIWTFKTAVLALNLKHVAVAEKEDPARETISLGSGKIRSRLADPAFDLYSLASEDLIFSPEGVILHEGQEDELLTAFYLVNCVQEYKSTSVDAIGRFRFENSYQQRFGKIAENFATVLFRRYFEKHLPHPLRNSLQERSRFFFSHDIDSLYGAFLQDGFAAFKKGRIDVIAKLVINAVFLKPDWFNIDDILKIDNEYDLRSTFFWIVNKGRVSKTLTNADYRISSPRIQETIRNVRGKGSHIGLHKSLTGESFDEEVNKLGTKVIVNRNHYLRFSIPSHFDAFGKSSLRIDCSLGFAEHYGFRNSLAIPFVPFDLENKKPYPFLEVPLNVMDGTFQKYMNVPPEKVSAEIIAFIEKNKYNSVLSVLWHNHFFNGYRFGAYFAPYMELLEYIKKNKFTAISPDQLYNKFYFSSQV